MLPIILITGSIKYMKNIIGLIIGIAVICFIFSAIGDFGKYEGQTAEEWFNEYDDASAQVEELNTEVEGLQTALQEANDNIEQANRNIESAKLYSGESYGEIVDALDYLNTVNTIDEP